MWWRNWTAAHLSLGRAAMWGRLKSNRTIGTTLVGASRRSSQSRAEYPMTAADPAQPNGRTVWSRVLLPTQALPSPNRTQPPFGPYLAQFRFHTSVCGKVHGDQPGHDRGGRGQWSQTSSDRSTTAADFSQDYLCRPEQFPDRSLPPDIRPVGVGSAGGGSPGLVRRA